MSIWNFILDNLSSIISVALLALLLSIVIAIMAKRRRGGKTSCGCDCSFCGRDCPNRK